MIDLQVKKWVRWIEKNVARVCRPAPNHLPGRPGGSGIDSKVEKWRRWIDEHISPDIHMIYLQRAAYRRVQEIVEANPRLPRDSYFWEYLEDTYAVTQATAVRRQAEVSGRVRSLGQLIAEVEANSDKITREFFVGMWGDPDDRDEIRRKLTEHTANGAFDDKFAGSVGEHLDPAIPSTDLADLTRAAAGVKGSWTSTSPTATDDPVARCPPSRISTRRST